MPLRFSANLTTMFEDLELFDRFARAREFGFQCIEITDPYVLAPFVMQEKIGDLECDLINLHGGQTGWGSASLPLGEGELMDATDKIKEYYDVLKFKKLHIPAGLKYEKITPEEQMNIFIQRLKVLDSEGFLENRNLIALIEPICKETKKNYFLNSFEMAIKILQEVDNDNIKLLLDIYHLHKITGDVKKNLEKFYPYAGHIQISQDPGRREPFFPGGKVDYEYVFTYLEKQNHSDWIGLEYKPSNYSVDAFEWMRRYSF